MVPIRGAGDTIYQDNIVTTDDTKDTGDGTVPLKSELGGFTSDTDEVTLLGYTQGGNTQGAVDHSGIVSNPDVEQKILEMFGDDIDPSKISTGHGIDLAGAKNIVSLVVDPVQAIVTDASGNRLGYTDATGPLAEIPNSEYIGGADGFGLISGPVTMPLTVTLTGLGGSYTLGFGGVEGTAYGGVDLAGTLADAEQTVPIPFEAWPGITVTPTSGLITSEEGGTATFTVVLERRQRRM